MKSDFELAHVISNRLCALEGSGCTDNVALAIRTPHDLQTDRHGTVVETGRDDEGRQAEIIGEAREGAAAPRIDQ